MLMRFAKQFIIASIFLVVLLGVVLWLWQLTIPKPTCFDGIKNQNEEGVDCGGVCKMQCKKVPQYEKVSVISEEMFRAEQNTYDVLAQVENKNSDFGLPNFTYEFQLMDASGITVVSRTGTSYLLPGEKKYLAFQKIVANRPVIKVKLNVSNEQWLELDEFASANLLIRDKNYSPVSASDSGVTYYRASGVVVNKTGYDFSQVDLVVVLKDENGKNIEVGASDVKELRDGTQRSFEVDWPGTFDGKVAKVEIEAYTNLLANENFINKYGLNINYKENYLSPGKKR